MGFFLDCAFRTLIGWAECTMVSNAKAEPCAFLRITVAHKRGYKVVVICTLYCIKQLRYGFLMFKFLHTKLSYLVLVSELRNRR